MAVREIMARDTNYAAPHTYRGNLTLHFSRPASVKTADSHISAGPGPRVLLDICEVAN
jgi:hypothetical protein